MRVSAPWILTSTELSPAGRNPAVAENDLTHIFDRFYRADQSRTQDEGSGLGLAIAKWIADMHHADLSVMSEASKGTVFQVSFPCV